MGSTGAVRVGVPCAVAVVSLALSACSASGAGDRPVEGGPVAFVTASSDGGDAALLEGTLRVSDSCVVIEDERGRTWLPIFQSPRTTWDGATLTYNGAPYTDGGTISLGGGYDDEPLDADYAPGGCDVDGVFYVAP